MDYSGVVIVARHSQRMLVTTRNGNTELLFYALSATEIKYIFKEKARRILCATIFTRAQRAQNSSIDVLQAERLCSIDIMTDLRGY